MGSPPQPVRDRRKAVGLPGSAALLCMAAPCVHAAIGGVGASFQMSAPRRFLPPWSVEASRIIALPQRIIELNSGNGMVGVRLSGFVMTRLASRASTSGRGPLTFIQPQGFELKSVRMRMMSGSSTSENITPMPSPNSKATTPRSVVEKMPVGGRMVSESIPNLRLGLFRG